jgi:hypothetical protein
MEGNVRGSFLVGLRDVSFMVTFDQLMFALLTASLFLSMAATARTIALVRQVSYIRKTVSKLMQHAKKFEHRQLSEQEINRFHSIEKNLDAAVAELNSAHYSIRERMTEINIAFIVVVVSFFLAGLDAMAAWGVAAVLVVLVLTISVLVRTQKRSYSDLRAAGIQFDEDR